MIDADENVARVGAMSRDARIPAADRRALRAMLNDRAHMRTLAQMAAIEARVIRRLTDLADVGLVPWL